MSFRQPFCASNNLFYPHCNNATTGITDAFPVGGFQPVSTSINSNLQLSKQTDFMQSSTFRTPTVHVGNINSIRNPTTSTCLPYQAFPNAYNSSKYPSQELRLASPNYSGGYMCKPPSTNEMHFTNSNVNLKYSETCTPSVNFSQTETYSLQNSQTCVTNVHIQTSTVHSMTFSNTGNNNVNNHQDNESNQRFHTYAKNLKFQSESPVILNNQSCLNNSYQSQNVTHTFPKITQNTSLPTGITNQLLVNPDNLGTSAENHNLVTLSSGNFLSVAPILPISFHIPPPSITNNAVSVAPPIISNDKLVPFSKIVSHTVTSEKQLKVSEFLAKFPAVKKTENVQLTIPDFRSAVRTGFLILKELLQRKYKLSNLLQSDEVIWNLKMKQIYELEAQLSEICGIVSSPLNLSYVMKKLKVIKKKRGQKKKTKLNSLAAKLKAEQARKELSLEIDKWLEDIKEKNLKLKREAEMKKEADYILLEVRRKIHEAKRTIEKIKVFEKLRNVRQANAVKKGLHILPEHNTNFEKKASTLKKLMLKQLADYEAEEKALKVMLETEQEGQLEEEAQWKLKKLKTLQQKKQKLIYECLFSSTDDPLPSDPLYLFHKYQTSANDSIENLVQVRHHWDVYLEEEGENIPQQWVVPLSECDASWKEWLSNS